MSDQHSSPLDNLLKALQNQSPVESVDEMRVSLKERGIDPDRSIARARETVRPYLKEHRLAWMKEARGKLADFLAVKNAHRSWLEESQEKIEETFRKVLAGEYGVEFGNRAAVAFRNRKETTVRDKAALLDSLALLQQMQDKHDEPGGGEGGSK
jgi:hypothetical protein